MFISTGLGPYWFLFALFWCKVLCDLVIRLNKVVCVTLWIVCLLLPLIFKFRIPVFVSQGIMALPFYLTGYCCSEKLRNMKTDYRWIFVFLGTFVLTIAMTYLNGKVSMNGYMFGQLHPALSIPVFYLNGFVGSLMILALALLPLPELPSVNVLSRALITILGVQGIFIGIYSLLIGKGQNLLVSTIASVVIMWLCYLFHTAFHKLYQWK